MSPMYVARRAVSEEPLIPAWTRPKASVENRPTAEDKVFDKAELAASGTAVREDAETARASIEQLEELAATQEGAEAEKTQSMIEVERTKLERLSAQIKQLDEAQSLQE